MFHPDYIKISTLDMSKNVNYICKLETKKFESYYCREPITIGVNTSILFKAIKSASEEMLLPFFMDADDTDKFGIELSDLFQGK
jgi:hypothetical protein